MHHIAMLHSQRICTAPGSYLAWKRLPTPRGKSGILFALHVSLNTEHRHLARGACWCKRCRKRNVRRATNMLQTTSRETTELATQVPRVCVASAPAELKHLFPCRRRRSGGKHSLTAHCRRSKHKIISVCLFPLMVHVHFGALPGTTLVYVNNTRGHQSPRSVTHGTMLVS